MITTVSQMERTTADDVVTTAHWNASIVDGDYSANAYGTQSFTRDADSPTLVAFADLTEETVVGWLTLDEGLEANLLAQIEEQKNPTSATGVAW
tara:strand:- start:57 stop:338 length:282 start_codon:yes stop_codon:yes gene_type:complete